MDFALTIKSLYAVNGFVAVLLYLPQIVSAIRDKERALSLSLVTFAGWSIGSFITALYAWYLVQDKMFTAISLGNMAGSGAIVAIILFSRCSVRSASVERTSSFQARRDHSPLTTATSELS